MTAENEDDEEINRTVNRSLWKPSFGERHVILKSAKLVNPERDRDPDLSRSFEGTRSKKPAGYKLFSFSTFFPLSLTPLHRIIATTAQEDEGGAFVLPRLWDIRGGIKERRNAERRRDSGGEEWKKGLEGAVGTPLTIPMLIPGYA